MRLNPFTGFNLFGRAYHATAHEIWLSVKLLAVVTFCFAILLYLAENAINPDYTFWDALVWTFVKYVEDPADIASAPMTAMGKIIGTLVGVLGIAIFAVPAGLIGSGMMDAMAEEKHEKEIAECYRRIKKMFRRTGNRSLRAHLNTLPDKGGEKLSKLNFVPRRVPLSKLEIRQGLTMKDLYEVCRRFPDVCIKNMADTVSDEEKSGNNYVVELFPVNTSYGCCIDRHSNVTVVCTTGYTEAAIGWFSYYMAKLGGFNYVCKNIEVDPDELDSYYNMSDEALYDKKKRQEFTKKDKEALRTIDLKEQHRRDFLADIRRLTGGREDAWVMLHVDHVMNSENVTDFHFSDNIKDGTQPAVSDRERYEAFYRSFSTAMSEEFEMSSTSQSERYPMLKKNLAYRLKKEGIPCNAFVLRSSSSLLNYHPKKMVVAWRMAQLLSQHLDGGKGIADEDVKDFATTRFGFAESK